jgi:hypothetical protein
MSFKIESQSSYQAEDLKFTVNLKNWTESEILINVNFEYPELVSNGKSLYDKLKFEILNKTLFKSQ